MEKNDSTLPAPPSTMPVFNMAQFTSIPPFKGKPFVAWSNEEMNGGVLEPPHVHIKLQEGELKCWLGKDKNQVSKARDTRVPEHIVKAVIRHIQDNWMGAAQDWNKYVEDNYPQFVNDERCIVPLPKGDSNAQE